MTRFICRVTGHRLIIHASHSYQYGKRWHHYRARACWCGAHEVMWETRA